MNNQKTIDGSCHHNFKYIPYTINGASCSGCIKCGFKKWTIHKID